MHGLVSVIIPTYNRARLLNEAIHSVHAQTYRPIECIVVDDGSTDGTDIQVKELLQLNDDQFNLIYIRHENAGAQVARNTGTAAAKGEYIQYLDSDDLLYPDKFSNQVRFLQEYPEFDGVFGDWEKGQISEKELIKGYLLENPIEQFLTERCIANFSFLMRAEIVKKTGHWDPNIKRNQEIDFHVRAILSGGRFSNLSIITGLWRTHNDTRIANSTNLIDVVCFFQKMERILEERNLFSLSLKRKIARLYMWLISENIDSCNKSLIPILKEALRLDPNISFYQNIKLRFLSFILGKDFAFHFWLNRFRIKHHA
jgi:glycosyltransferase involved in cell wall biosynthesis